MRAQLLRHTFDPRWTLGTLYVDGAFQCFMLEDPDRLAWGFEKVLGDTAIPAGTYEIVHNWSTKFERPLPLLLDVPGFTGVRIHPGNWPKDTEGCPLPGYGIEKGRTVASVKAFTPLNALIRNAQRAGGFQLEIETLRPRAAVGDRLVEAWDKEGLRAAASHT